MTARRTPSNPEVENGHPIHATSQDGDVAGNALDNAIGRARTHEAKRIEEILGYPDMIRGEELGILLSVTPQVIGKWRRKGLVLGLKGRTRTFRYPKWQITDDGELLPGLKEVAGELGEPWMVYGFLLQSYPELEGKTALECQSAPKVDPLSASKVDPMQYGSGRPDAAGRDCAVGATAGR